MILNFNLKIVILNNSTDNVCILLSFATDRLAQPYDSRSPKQFSCPLATTYPPALAMKLGNTRHNFTARIGFTSIKYNVITHLAIQWKLEKSHSLWLDKASFLHVTLKNFTPKTGYTLVCRVNYFLQYIYLTN